MTDPLLSVTGLNVWLRPRDRRPVHVVRDLDFEVAHGERVGLIGESGCGKTTTVLAVMGLLPHHSAITGSIRLNGTELLTGGEEPFRRHRWTDVAMVFQGSMNALNPVRDIRKQLAEAVRRGDPKLRRAACDRRIAALLDMVGLTARRADQYAHELSGGMRQRVCLAMALACDPVLLLADEPSTALDVIVQAQVLSLVRRLSEEHGLAVVLVSHDIPSVGEVCERGAVMYSGRVVEDAPFDRLDTDPRHPYTAALFAAIPRLDRGHPTSGIPGRPPALTSHDAACPFAPRCSERMEICDRVLPPLEHVGPNQAAACHRASTRPFEGVARV